MKNFYLNKDKEGGISILGLLFLGLLVILTLSYLNINIQRVVESPSGQDNLSYVGEMVRTVWNDYFKASATYLWNDVWLKIFWRPFISNMEHMRDGQPTDLDNASPTVPY